MDWVAGTFELIGVLMIGNLWRQGFLVCLVCNGLWIAVAINSGVHGLILVSGCMAIVNIRNYRKWATLGKES